MYTWKKETSDSKSETSGLSPNKGYKTSKDVSVLEDKYTTVQCWIFKDTN